MFITFLTDFGLQDDFVGTCHGVMRTIAPDVQIIDVTHGIPAGGILQGAPMGAAQVVELASLPPADVLQGQVLGAIVGPLTSIVGLLDARVEQLGVPEEAPVEVEEAKEETPEEAPLETSAETSEETADEAAEETPEEE